MEKIKTIADGLFREIEDADTFLQVYKTIAFFREEMENHMRIFVKKHAEKMPPELTEYIFRSF